MYIERMHSDARLQASSYLDQLSGSCAYNHQDDERVTRDDAVGMIGFAHVVALWLF